MSRDGLAVALACDDRYAPYAACLAERIVDLHPGLPVVLASLAPLALPPHLAARGIRARVLATGAFDGMPPGRIGAAGYARLALPDALRAETRRVLYLDCDIWPELGGIDRLAGLDLGGAAVGAVRDNQQWRAPGRRVSEWAAVGGPARPYLNSGVLLIDTDAWADANLTARCLAVARDRPAAVTRQDQSLINLALDGAWAEMSPVWNWQMTRATRHFADAAGARLLHFIGPRKPWSPQGGQPRRVAEAMAAYLARHYPDRPRPPLDRAPIDRTARAALLRHWLGARATERYLARFPDPWTVRRPAGD